MRGLHQSMDFGAVALAHWHSLLVSRLLDCRWSRLLGFRMEKWARISGGAAFGRGSVERRTGCRWGCVGGCAAEGLLFLEDGEDVDGGGRYVARSAIA
jgi:hypothetical protein